MTGRFNEMSLFHEASCRISVMHLVITAGARAMSAPVLCNAIALHEISCNTCATQSLGKVSGGVAWRHLSLDFVSRCLRVA